MNQKQNREKQRRYTAAKKAQGLKRIVLWVQPEDVVSLRLAAKQPHALAQQRAKVEAEIERQMWGKVAAKLERRTERAMLAQKRAQARRQTAGSNRPPELIRFERRPPGAVRNRIKAAGWVYDPVAVVWHLPDNPEVWPDVQKLLDALDGYGIEHLSKPLDR